jgi:hypothetical protein
MAADSALSNVRLISVAALTAAATSSAQQRTHLHPLTTTTTQAANDILQALRGVCGGIDQLQQLRGPCAPPVAASCAVATAAAALPLPP